jgi:hypothetical protein
LFVLLWPANKQSLKEYNLPAAAMTTGEREALQGLVPVSFCSADTKVDVKSDVPLVAKTVGDLCSLSSWQPGLTLSFPSRGDRYPDSVVVVEQAS